MNELIKSNLPCDDCGGVVCHKVNCSKERNLIGNNREKRIEMIINFFRTNQILTGYWYNITTWHELEKAADFIHEDPADVLEAYELLQEEIWDDEVME